MPVQSRLLRNHPFGDRGDADRDRDVADRTLQTSVGPGQPARGVCERHITIKNGRMPFIDAIPRGCKPVTPPALSAPLGPVGEFGEPPLAQSGKVAEVEVKKECGSPALVLAV